MHRPVLARHLAVLARTVERVDDPDPVGAEPVAVVDGLLGQDGVVGAQLREDGGDRRLGVAVAAGLEVGGSGGVRAEREEHLRRGTGCLDGDLDIRQRGALRRVARDVLVHGKSSWSG